MRGVCSPSVPLRELSPRVPFLMLCDHGTYVHTSGSPTTITHSIPCWTLSKMFRCKTALITIKTLAIRSAAAAVISSSKPSAAPLERSAIATLNGVYWLRPDLKRLRRRRRESATGNFVRLDVFVSPLVSQSNSVHIIGSLGRATEVRLLLLI